LVDSVRNEEGNNGRYGIIDKWNWFDFFAQKEYLKYKVSLKF